MGVLEARVLFCFVCALETRNTGKAAYEILCAPKNATRAFVFLGGPAKLVSENTLRTNRPTSIPRLRRDMFHYWLPRIGSEAGLQKALSDVDPKHVPTVVEPLRLQRPATFDKHEDQEIVFGMNCCQPRLDLPPSLSRNNSTERCYAVEIP